MSLAQAEADTSLFGFTLNDGTALTHYFGSEVGLNTSDPSVELDINGNVSANNLVLTGLLSVTDLTVGGDENFY